MSSVSFRDPGNLGQIEHSIWGGYLEVASLTLLTWDYILTSREEIDLVWRRPKKWPTLLFATNRYFPFVDQAINTIGYVSTDVSYSFCKFASAYWFTATTIFQIFLTDVIVWHCVCALYMNSKKIRWPLLSLLIVSMLSAALIVGIMGIHTQDSAQPVPVPGKTRCMVYTQYHNMWFAWIPILVYEAITLILVARQFCEYRWFKGRNTTVIGSSLARLVIKETVVYLSFVLVMFIANMVLFRNADHSLSGILIPVAMVMLSILGNRMLLSLRQELGTRTVGGSSDYTTNFTTLRFAARERIS